MSQMHECSQVIHSTVEVLLHQMLNHQHTSLSCLGAVLLLMPRPSILLLGAVNVSMRVVERQLCLQLRTGTRHRPSLTRNTTSCPVSECSWHFSTPSRTTTRDYHSESFSHWVTRSLTSHSLSCSLSHSLGYLVINSLSNSIPQSFTQPPKQSLTLRLSQSLCQLLICSVFAQSILKHHQEHTTTAVSHSVSELLINH